MSNTHPRFHYPRIRNSGGNPVTTALCGTHINDAYRIAADGVDCCDCRVKLRNCAIDSAQRKGMTALVSRLKMGLSVESLLRRAAKAVGWIPNDDIGVQ